MAPQITYFDRLRLKNVRCFRDAEVPFDKRVTVIVGGNASGKTTLMEALASVTHGDDEGLKDFPFRHGTARGEVALYEHGRKSAAARWDSKLPLRGGFQPSAMSFSTADTGAYCRPTHPKTREARWILSTLTNWLRT
jgi:hypothetical protein